MRLAQWGRWELPTVVSGRLDASPGVSNALTTVVNGALDHVYRGLLAALRRGEDFHAHGAWVTRVPDEARAAAQASWEARTGLAGEEDLVVVGTIVHDQSEYVSRAALVALLEALGADPRPVPVRPSAPSPADQLAAYAKSPERATYLPDLPPLASSGDYVDMGWFRDPSPPPDTSTHPWVWLSFFEAILREAQPPADRTRGLFKRGGQWFELTWRFAPGADRPTLVSARRFDGG